MLQYRLCYVYVCLVAAIFPNLFAISRVNIISCEYRVPRAKFNAISSDRRKFLFRVMADLPLCVSLCDLCSHKYARCMVYLYFGMSF